METSTEPRVPRPRIVSIPGEPNRPAASSRGSRLDRYRERYSEFRGEGAVLVTGKQPVPVFLTLKFWRGFALLGLLNVIIFWTIGNVDMSWLVHANPVNPSKSVPKFNWPKGMVPLQVERTSDGELIVTVPTRTLTPEEQATLKQIWESQRTSVGH